MQNLAIASVSLLALSLSACVSQGHPALAPSAEGDNADDYRISVEIPLEELQISDAEILKVNELLDERTGFDPEDFQLDEVVLIARGNDAAGANAELLVLEWRSGQVVIPPGGEEDWFEVRVPAPEEDNGGAWLLDITGAATVNLLVAVLEPRPRVVEEIAKTTTTYHTRTVYRDRVIYPRTYPRTYHSYWIYEPSRYYTVHYHGMWPYRYFIGPWDYRYYDLTFRPYRYHYGPIYRSHRHGNRASSNDYIQARETAGSRRISSELVQLRRNHPRLRNFYQRQTSRRPSGNSARHEEAKRNHPRLRTSYQRQTSSRPSGNNARYEEAKRTHPRLRTFHRPQSERQTPSSVAPPIPPRREAETRAPSRHGNVVRRNVAPERRSSAHTPAASNARSRSIRQAARRPTAAAPPPSTVRRVPPARNDTSRSNARTRMHRTNPAAPPTQRTAPVRSAAPTRPNIGTRSFERRQRTAPARIAPRAPSAAPRRPSMAPRQPSQAPARQRSSPRPERRSEPAAPRSTPSNSRRPVFERR